MSEFSSGFWDLYIALLSVISIVACALFLKSQSVQRKPGAVETTGHQWDGDLAEYNNPLPSWWSWLFYLTIVFSLAYLVLYPGLGSWRGTLGWSQVGQLEEEQAAAERGVALAVGAVAGDAVLLVELAAERDAQRVGVRPESERT